MCRSPFGEGFSIEALRTNFGLLQAAVASPDDNDVLALLERWGLGGARRFVIPGGDIALNKQISNIGGTSQVWEATLYGREKVGHSSIVRVHAA